jgi:hypothetical protein
VARMGEGRGVYRVLVGRPEGKRPLVRPARRWEDNIKTRLCIHISLHADGRLTARIAQMFSERAEGKDKVVPVLI